MSDLSPTTNLKKPQTFDEQPRIPQNICQNRLDNKSSEQKLTSSKWQAEKYSRIERSRRNLKAFIPGQTLITNFVQVITTVEKLLNENENLRQTLTLKLQESDKSKEYNLNSNRLLEILVVAAERNSGKNKNGNRFDSKLVLFVTYIYLLGGRMLFEVIHKNLGNSFPSISTTERCLAKFDKRIVEGQFRFDELKTFVEERKLPNLIWVSEDATRIKSAVEYDRDSNQLVGFTAPFDDNGYPKIRLFEAKNGKAVENFFNSSKVSNYAYVIMSRPLKFNSPSFCLNVFGSDNHFTADLVRRRWDRMREKAEKSGCKILGFSGDGDPRVLSAMRSIAFAVDNYDIPSEWAVFFVSKMETDLLCVQDPSHILTKFRNRALNPNANLHMGSKIVSFHHFKDVINDYTKDKHSLCLFDINHNDKMNVKSAIKLCSIQVHDLLNKSPEREATAVFVSMMNNVANSFMNEDLAPLERINCIWRTNFILKIWWRWLVDNHYDLKTNFISSNAYMCVELNAHAMISAIIYFRNNGIPESFLPWLLDSQSCEEFFRAVRLLTSTYSTLVNFSMLELLHKINRVNFQSEIVSQLHDDFEFPREQKREINSNIAQDNLKHMNLPTDQEMLKTIKLAFEEAFDVTKMLGMEFKCFSKKSIILPTKLSRMTVELANEIEKDEFERNYEVSVAESVLDDDEFQPIHLKENEFVKNLS